jgi:hypothetical protein
MRFEQDERNLRRELEYHVELLTLDYVSRGVAHREARRQAMIAFGGVELAKERCRDVRSQFLARTRLRAAWAWLTVHLFARFSHHDR